MSNSVNLALDVTKTNVQNTSIKIRQGDGGFETLHTTVTSNGDPMDLQGWTITFMGTTAGNHKIIDANVKIVEAPNGIFEYTPSKAWGMDIGYFKIAYFKFVNGDGSTSSANFRVNVIEAVDLSQEEGQNYISVIDATIEETREHLESSLADVSASVAATSVAASSMAVNVSNAASSAADNINGVASNAIESINIVASSAVNNVNINASNAIDKVDDATSSYTNEIEGVTTSAVDEIGSAASGASLATSRAIDEVNSVASSAVNDVNVNASNASSVASSAVANVSSTASNVVDKLNNISVGGRNLLLDTGRSFIGVGDGSVNGNFDAQGGMYYLAGGKKASDLYKQYGENSYLTFSFDWVASGSTLSGQFNPQWAGNPYGGLSSSGPINISSTKTSGHYKSTAQLTGGYPTGTATSIQFRQDNLQGNVTISNVKLETGNIATDWTPAPEDVNTAMGAYVKSVRELPAEAHDFAVIASDMSKYQGTWYVDGTKVSNGPETDWNWCTIEVLGGYGGFSGIIRTANYGPNREYVTTVNGRKMIGWKKMTDDNNVVHKTGNETAAGDKTFTGNTTLASTTILAGNYGLRVTPSGFQKTTDGKTWVAANI